MVVVAALVWLGLRAAPSEEGWQRGDRFATIRVLDGLVETAERGGLFAPVEESGSLREGGRVRTGQDALAEIDYQDGSLTRIGPETTYEIVELEQEGGRTVIVGKIGLGETFHDVKDLTGTGSRFEVQESNAIAGVRGTRFAARCLPPLPCGIAVVEGVVEVTPSSGDTVSVEAGQRVTIDDDGLLGEVTEVSPDDPWLNRNRDIDAGN